MASNALDALMVSLPLVKEIFRLDSQICLCDRTKTIGVWYANTFHMNVVVGEIIDGNKPGHDMLLKAMETGIGNSGILPEFVYGVAVDGIITPVFEDGKVVGVISAAVSIKERLEVEHATENLNRNLASSQVITSEIAKGSLDLAEKLDKVRSFSLKIEELAKGTSSIVKGIQGNSRKSNILAINASIEAARAGEKGRGFSIVASEMGDLAKVSEESTRSISSYLEDIFSKLNAIISEINYVADISTTQAAALKEISSTLENISLDANKLESIAKIN